MRFEYLVEWDPDCLILSTYRDLPLRHALNEFWTDNLTRFNIYLQSTLEHHPQHLRMLFQKDASGQTVYKRAMEKHCEDETFNIIKQHIPTDTTLPILRHVMRDAPKHVNDFT